MEPLYIIVLICAMGQPCNKESARAYQAFRAPEGIRICALPGTMVGIARAGLDDGEELHIRCRM